MHTICRIPPGSQVQYNVLGSWFPLEPGDYHGYPKAKNPERTYLQRCDGGGGKEMRKYFEVQTEAIARYAVELVEKADPPPIGIHAVDLPVMQEALRIAAVLNPQGGTPEDDLAWILRQFILQHGDAKPKGGLAAVMGKWPGDESDEEIERALKELS